MFRSFNATRRLRPDLRLLLVASSLAALAIPARAQRDEFDLPSPGEVVRTPDQPTAPTPVPTQAPTPPVSTVPVTDTPVDDASGRSVVRVLVADAPSLTNTNLACTSGRLASANVTAGTGLVLADGKTVVVPAALVANGYALAVHGSDPNALVAGRILYLDTTSELALLRLLEPIDGIVAPSSDGGGVVASTPLTAATRLPDGRLVQTAARVQYVQMGDDVVASFEALGDTAGRVVFRGGRPIGLLGAPLAGGAAWTRHVHSMPRIERAIASIDRDARADTDEGMRGPLGAATRLLVRLATTASAEERCALLRAPEFEDARNAPPIDPAAASARELVVIAALVWDLAISDPASPAEPGIHAEPFVSVDRAIELDPGIETRSRFAWTLHSERSRELERVAGEERARAEAERERDERVRARERRRNLPLTYHAALTSGFARDGSVGLGSAGVSFGAFASLPRLPATGSLRAAAAIGASAALGVGGGFLGLLSLDLGASFRFGGEHGGFVLLAYAPAVLSAAIESSPSLVFSSFRVASGVALGRRVLFVGYRVLTPRGDFAAHLLEVGIAFRHGPSAARSASVATNGQFPTE